MVVVGHPYADFDCPPREWMARGPGPRHGTRPVSARSRTTGEALPLTVIPLEYRNDWESRALIAAGKLPSPWRDRPWRVDDWGQRPCEVYGPQPFDRTVADPERIDRLAAGVLRALPPGPVDDEAARRILAEVPEFGETAGLVVCRLAAAARWDEFDAVVELAAAAGLVDVAPVLAELIESDAAPPRPGRVVEALGRLKDDDDSHLMHRLLARSVYADKDLRDVRRCLHALIEIGTDRSLARPHLISWQDWPDPIPRWAAEELLAGTGRALGEFGPDGSWTPGFRVPGWRPD